MTVITQGIDDMRIVAGKKGKFDFRVAGGLFCRKSTYYKSTIRTVYFCNHKDTQYHKRSLKDSKKKKKIKIKIEINFNHFWR